MVITVILPSRTFTFASQHTHPSWPRYCAVSTQERVGSAVTLVLFTPRLRSSDILFISSLHNRRRCRWWREDEESVFATETSTKCKNKKKLWFLKKFCNFSFCKKAIRCQICRWKKFLLQRVDKIATVAIVTKHTNLCPITNQADQWKVISKVC